MNAVLRNVRSAFAQFPVGSRETGKIPRMSLEGCHISVCTVPNGFPLDLQASRSAVLRNVRSAFARFPVGSRETGKIRRMSLEGCHISVGTVPSGFP